MRRFLVHSALCGQQLGNLAVRPLMRNTSQCWGTLVRPMELQCARTTSAQRTSLMTSCVGEGCRGHECALHSAVPAFCNPKDTQENFEFGFRIAYASTMYCDLRRHLGQTMFNNIELLRRCHCAAWHERLLSILGISSSRWRSPF